MSIAEKLQTIAENQQRVYDAGFAAGQAASGDSDAAYQDGFVAGKKAEWDAFWEVFQNHGKATSYQHAFSLGKFTDENYNPKYPLRFASDTVVGGQYVFYASPITDTKVDIIAGNNRPLSYCFQGCENLHTIRKLVLNGTNTFGNTFTNCTSLTNIVIEGVIGKSINFQWSPLSVDSMKSVIAALKNFTGTDSEFTETVYFDDACWESLEADSTAPNGSSWKGYVQNTLRWNI